MTVEDTGHGLVIRHERNLNDKEQALYDGILACFVEGNDAMGGWNEVGRRELGRYIYEGFLKPCGMDNAKAMAKLGQFWANSGVTSDMNMHVTCASPGMLSYELELGLWYASAFPKVVIKPKYAAALVATRLSADVAEFIVPPWDTFMIELPDSIFTYINKQGNACRVDHICVRGKDGYWDFATLSGSWEMSRSKTASTSKLLDVSEGDILSDLDDSLLNESPYGQYTDATAYITGFDRESLHKVMKQNARLQVAVGRLVAGACLAMSDPTNLRFVRPKKGRPLSERYNKRLKGLPLVREHVLGKPIKIDCRQAVQDFVVGAGKAPSVQTLVRGHWKRQAHGPDRVHRKVIHIEPYWRGPEDAAIVTRPHVLADMHG